MFCNKCGKQAAKGDRFRSNCGTPIDIHLKSISSIITPLVENYRKKPYFYSSFILCSMSIFMLFFNWLHISAFSNYYYYTGLLPDETLLTLIKSGITVIRTLFFNGSGWYNANAAPITILVRALAYMSCILVIISGIRYGIALYKLYRCRNNSTIEDITKVFLYIRAVSKFAITIFIIQVVAFAMAHMLSFSLTAYSYLLFSVINNSVAKHAIKKAK